MLPPSVVATMTAPQTVGSVVMRDLAAQITVAAPVKH